MPSAYGFPNCVGWYVATQGVYSDAGSTPAAAGAAVYQWDDQSGLGNHLVQTAAGNRPVYNPYAAVQTAAGPPGFAPFGPTSQYYAPAGRPSVLFDGVNSFLNLPAAVALPSTGCTVVMCTRGAYFAPVSFGTDGYYTINCGWVGGTPPHMAMYNSGLRPFGGPTYLPELVPFVHGFRASAALGETRLYMGTNQQSTYGSNCCNFAVSGGAVGRTLNLSDGGYGNHSFAGEIFEIAIYSSPLSNAMMTTLLADMQAANDIRADANACQVIFVGDSLTAGGPYPGPITACYPWHLCRLYANAFKPLVVAVPGQTIAQQQSLALGVTTGLDVGPFATSAAVVCCGSNDALNGASAATILAGLTAMCGGLRANGLRVVLLTITPRSDAQGAAAGAPATILSVNATLRTSYHGFADVLVDWAADPRLADSTNPIYFADGVHTTDAGDGVKAQLVRAGLDTLPGFGASVAAVAKPLAFASFYAPGQQFAGSFGNFVQS